jgi:hypothetical protein
MLRVEVDLTVKIIFQLLDIPINKALVRFAKLLKGFQQLFCRPGHGIVPTALRFNLHHQYHVIEQLSRTWESGKIALN